MALQVRISSPCESEYLWYEKTMGIKIARRVRRTRAEQNTETRARLLEAARKVFVVRGFHGTTVDAVAERAGFSKGAVYSQFDSKDDLYLALLDRHIDERLREVDHVCTSAADVDTLVDALAAQWLERSQRARGWALLATEFRVHAARHFSVQRRHAAMHHRLRVGIADALGRAWARLGYRPELSAADAARFGLAWGTGLLLERWSDDCAFDDGELRRVVGRAVFPPRQRRVRGGAR
jgi:AcrR family transcriptional regulator